MERGISIALDQFLPSYAAEHNPPHHVHRSLSRICNCRTEAMGGCRMVCGSCGEEFVLYNSCRDRHCPGSCQGANREAWLLSRKEELPAVTCFHAVFTIPGVLHPLALGNMRKAYGALFSAMWGTILAFASAREIRMGVTSLLHTWGSNLSHHPHLHCIVPGGGVDLKTGHWKSLPHIKDGKGSEPFLFPVRAMGKMFRAKFMAAFTEKVKVPGHIRAECFPKPWAIYAKAPVCGAEITLEYLAGYAFRTAISNERVVDVDENDVIFHYKDVGTGEKPSR